MSIFKAMQTITVLTVVAIGAFSSPAAMAQTKPCSPAICVTADGSQCTPEQADAQCSILGAEPQLEGYGTSSSFGGGPGSETCVVTNLNDSGAGSLRDCVDNRNGPTANPVPRTITFAVGGTITLTGDPLRLRQPYLTIDGLSAPAPGITIAKTGNGEAGRSRIQTWDVENTCGHDVLVQGLRFRGVWTRDTSTVASQKAPSAWRRS